MAEIYYVQNSKQYIKLLQRLLKDCEYEDIGEYGIRGCDLLGENESCSECESDECKLLNSLESSDIMRHVWIDEDILFKLPGILTLVDSPYRSERVTLISVTESKDNCKYGIE